MKRLAIILIAAALPVLFLLFLLTRSGGIDPSAPRFVPVQTQPPGPFWMVIYSDWGAPVPFNDGKTWIVCTTGSGKGVRCVLYDIDARKSVRELTNGWPALGNRDGTKILVSGAPTRAKLIKERLKAFLNRVWPGRVPLFPTRNVEAFWLMDTRNNSASFIGTIGQVPAATSRWIPSPGFRRGYSEPTGELGVVVCDLEAGVLDRMKLQGYPVGWWDDHTILAWRPTGRIMGEYVLLDVLTHQERLLFGVETVNTVSNQFHLTIGTTGLAAFPQWNGHGYDFYFYGPVAGQSLETSKTFLLKASSASPSLALVSRRFAFGRMGSFDESGARYVFIGEREGAGPGGPVLSAIMLLDLTNNTERVLTQPDDVGACYLPRFYRDSVIYSRNRILRRVDLNGSNNVPLLQDSAPTNSSN
jgi:hypothetical protein